MEGAGIWILLALFYLLQAITKNQQRKKRVQNQQSEEPPVKNKSIEDLFNRTTGRQADPVVEDENAQPAPKKPQENVSFEDIFNPEKLRDIFGVPQPQPEPQKVEKVEKSEPKPVVKPKIKQEMRKRWEEPVQEKPSLQHEEPKETVSKVASADITDVDETTARFKSIRLSKSDITSDRFDERKEAPGKKKPEFALEYFDDPEEIRNAVILKEILDRPRALRRNIR